MKKVCLNDSMYLNFPVCVWYESDGGRRWVLCSDVGQVMASSNATRGASVDDCGRFRTVCHSRDWQTVYIVSRYAQKAKYLSAVI